MAALTSERNVKKKDGKLISFPVAANTKIYKGGLVMLDGGYAKPAAGKANGVANSIFVGVAYETVDNSGGANGDLSIRVETEGTFEYAGDGVAADVGKVVYVEDDQTVSVTASANIGEENLKCGILVAVPNVGVNRIRIDNHVGEVAVTVA